MSSTPSLNEGNSKEISAQCAPCASLDSSALVPTEQVRDDFLPSSPLWTLSATVGKAPHAVLSRKFVAKNFQSALESVNLMGAIAEREGHHPDFHLTGYRNVEVILFTHKLGGITKNDLTLARLFDTEVEVAYSPKWLRDHPEAARPSS